MVLRTGIGAISDGWYKYNMVDRCCTCYSAYHGLLSVSANIYYLCVVKSTNLVMLMMMEEPEHGLAYAFETFTIM